MCGVSLSSPHCRSGPARRAAYKLWRRQGEEGGGNGGGGGVSVRAGKRDRRGAGAAIHLGLTLRTWAAVGAREGVGGRVLKHPRARVVTHTNTYGNLHPDTPAPASWRTHTRGTGSSEQRRRFENAEKRKRFPFQREHTQPLGHSVHRTLPPGYRLDREQTQPLGHSVHRTLPPGYRLDCEQTQPLGYSVHRTLSAGYRLDREHTQLPGHGRQRQGDLTTVPAVNEPARAPSCRRGKHARLAAADRVRTKRPRFGDSDRRLAPGFRRGGGWITAAAREREHFYLCEPPPRPPRAAPQSAGVPAPRSVTAAFQGLCQKLCAARADEPGHEGPPEGERGTASGGQESELGEPGEKI
ncbi:unnamed protein product [Lampetra fluviatilis]